MDIPLVFYHLGTEKPISPSDPLPPLPEIPRGSIVVLEGRAPVWRYGQAFHLLHGSPAIALASFDPRLGAVVIASHSPLVEEGSILDIHLEDRSIQL